MNTKAIINRGFIKKRNLHRIKRGFNGKHIECKNKKYRGIGLFKYRANVNSPFMWRSIDPFRACPILSVNAWNSMRFK